MADESRYRPGQRVVWVGEELHDVGPGGVPVQLLVGDTGTVVHDAWPTEFVVSFPDITLCCRHADVRPATPV